MLMTKISQSALTISRFLFALAIAHKHASPTAERTTPFVLQPAPGQRLPWRRCVRHDQAVRRPSRAIAFAISERPQTGRRGRSGRLHSLSRHLRCASALRRLRAPRPRRRIWATLCRTSRDQGRVRPTAPFRPMRQLRMLRDRRPDHATVAAGRGSRNAWPQAALGSTPGTAETLYCHAYLVSSALSSGLKYVMLCYGTNWASQAGVGAE